MKERGEVAENIQKVCPVSGDKLDDDKVSLTLSGRKIYFCVKNVFVSLRKTKRNTSKILTRKMFQK